MKNVLFICSANRDRSKTAEDYFAEKYEALNFQSAGTNLKICEQLGTNYISQEMLELADIIYVMERKHRNKINQHFSSRYNKKIEILNIPDYYRYYKPDLIEILNKKLDFENL